MRREYEGRGVGFLAISLEPRENRVRDAVATLGIETEVAIARGPLLGPLGVDAVPSTVFVTADGRIAAAASGYRNQAFFERRVEELLAVSAR